MAEVRLTVHPSDADQPGAVRPGELDEILQDLREHGIVPSKLNVIHAAIERGIPNDFVAVIGDAFERNRGSDLVL